MSAYLTPKSVGNPDVGPRTHDVSAFPGAPGVAGGVKGASDVPVQTGVVGQTDPLDGGTIPVPIDAAFPGYSGQTWQAGWQGEDMPVLNPSTINDEPGHVSGGIRVSHPDAFPGGGQAG